MSYLETYFSRVNHLGDTTADRIRNSGIRSFEKWMAESPHTVQQLFAERGLYFDGIILTNKDKEYEKIMFLNVANNTPIFVGDIIDWYDEDYGHTEKWIVIQEERHVRGTHKTYWIIRCNYLVKWIDSLGHLQSSWCYLVSSLDSKIKGNYRTWHNLITPQPNKYAEILMPRYDIDKSTNFIVEDESWTMIEYDHTSVPGTIYLSLTEGKINEIYDDLVNNIADTDKLAKYDLAIPDLPQIFNVGDEIKPTFTVTKNGIPLEAEVNLLPTNKTFTKIQDGRLVARSVGETDIIVQLREYPDIQQQLHIVISDAAQEFAAYIDGPATIRLARTASYELKATGTFNGAVKFSIDKPELVAIKSSIGANCVLLCNDKNDLGTNYENPEESGVVLSAVYGGKTYTKRIKIIPLW